MTTATEKETGQYLDDMIPILSKYVEYKLSEHWEKEMVENGPQGHRERADPGSMGS